MNNNIYPLYPEWNVSPETLRINETMHKRKIIFTSGSFDILHSGHLKLLNYCKKKGDILVVGLNTDENICSMKGINRPVNNLKERLDCLREISIIDYIYLFDRDTHIELLQQLSPDLIVIGGKYKKDNINGYRGSVEIFKYDNNYSTTDIINRIIQNNNLNVDKLSI